MILVHGDTLQSCLDVRTVFRASVLLLITGDVIKCSKLQVKQVISLHSFEHFMVSSVINKSTDARKTVRDLFFTKNLNWQVGRTLKFEGNCGVKQTRKTCHVIPHDF